MHSDPSPHSKPARTRSSTRTNSFVTRRPKREGSAEDRSSRSSTSTSGDSAAIASPFVLQETLALPCTRNTANPKDTPLVSASITDLVAEPLFYHGYLSEEEPLSTTDSDSMTSTSLDSTRESSLDLDNFEANFPELLAESCTFVEQQCGHAQAIVLKVVGRPKVIDVPSSPTHGQPTLKRAATSPIHGPVSRLSRISTSHSRKSSQSSSYNALPQPDTYRRSGSAPSTPILDSETLTPTSEFSPITPRTPKHSDFSYFNASRAAEDTDITPKAVKKPSRFRLTSIYKRTVSAETVPTLQPSTRPVTLQAPPSSPATYKPRMVARGACERSPMLELPPFPESETDDSKNGKAGRPWGLKRQDSMVSIGPKSVLGKKQPRIRRVESGLLR